MFERTIGSKSAISIEIEVESRDKWDGSSHLSSDVHDIFVGHDT